MERDITPRHLYYVYAVTTGHKNFLGDPMPEYDNLGALQKRAWETLSAYLRVD